MMMRVDDKAIGVDSAFGYAFQPFVGSRCVDCHVDTFFLFQ